MDISQMIVDLLRKSTEDEALNAGGPLASTAPQKGMGEEMAAAAVQLGNPDYAAYVKEAKASGEPVMSEQEFGRFQDGG